MKNNKVAPLKVIVLPKDPNPYQDLLYSPLSGSVELSYVTVFGHLLVVPRTLLRLSRLRLQGYRILHIHWIYSFYVSKRIPFHRVLSYVYISSFLTLVRVLRFKIVWTVHNVIPQSPVTTNDAIVMRKLARLADAKIVHSDAIIPEMKALQLSTDNTSVIPIGPYGQLYPDNITAPAARRKLHIAKDEFVILFFGVISAYKGPEELVQTFIDLGLPKSRLLIVGACADAQLKDRLTQAAAEHPQIDFYEGYVADEDVAMYFKASSVVCLPFRNNTTSSSVMLALAFGKPVVAPRLGTLRDLPLTVGYFYDSTPHDSLRTTLLQVAKHQTQLEHVGRQAKVYSESLSWESSAKKTYQLYSKLLNS